MKLRCLSMMLVATFGVAACTSDAQTEEPPRHALKSPVNDYADILSVETEAALSRDIMRAKMQYGPQLVVVTVPSLDGEDIAEYSLGLARAWGIGHKDRDDGLMLLVAPNERRVRIEVGRGIEASFTDIFAKQILEDYILPAFREEEYERGVIDGTTALIAKMRAVPTIRTNDNEVQDLKETG